MPTNYLITGASRGLGFETARQLLALSESNIVFAAARDPRSSKALQALAEQYKPRLHLVTLDTTSQVSVDVSSFMFDSVPPPPTLSDFLLILFLAAVAQVTKILGDQGLDALLNNAGVFSGGPTTFSTADKDSLIADISTNLYGVIYTTQGFLPLLKKGEKKQIFVTSSIMGSMGDDLGKTAYAINYSVSKAAVNMWTLKVANELGPEGFPVIPFHPGYVKTDMNGGTGGEITPQVSVEKTYVARTLFPYVLRLTVFIHDGETHRLKNIILKVKPEDNGTFLSYDGKQLKW
ncbi:BQ2448_7915 [Microbotryum intermedium]|uniref:BQ2448_7915 protein n=1 Tax=Microbotryum intermedium TaxID=269621 RepID=A0A238FV00_9BASI|nr:BQ2448_7915 [Microbotryum intermedium]